MSTGAQSEQWLAAARLVRRTGFGATGAEVDAAAKAGAAQYITSLMAYDAAADRGVRATPPPHFEAIEPLGKQADTAARKARNRQLRGQLQQLTGWWLRRMVAVEQPFVEKLTFGWHDHFATSAAKVRYAPLMLEQNQTFRTNARGSFSTMALAMLTDPAMLRWLDGTKNVAGAPNENLSREYLELFTLGHGNGYTETDVREGARALTGWTITADGRARLRPARHDSDAKTVLGVTGPLDQAGFCAAVLDRPQTAVHVAGRLYGRLVSGTAPSTERLAQLADLLRPQWSLSAVLENLLSAPDFQQARSTVVVTPVEWLVGAVRALRVPVDDQPTLRTLALTLKTLGQLPFYPPSVGGWPPGPAWLSTAAAEVRMRTAQLLTQRADLSAIAGADRIDAVGHLLGIGNFSERSRTVLAAQGSDSKRLVAVALNTPEYLTS